MLANLDNSDQQILWEFIRDDLPSAEFEQWLYNNKNLENAVSNEFYLELISTDFNSRSELYLLKKKLEDLLRQKQALDCECIALADNTVIDEGSERWERAFVPLKEIKKYGEPRWWISLYQCSKCSQYWLVAQESSINDIDLLKRIDTSIASNIIQKNEWPEYFKIEELLIIGKNNNRSVRFLDPFSFSLVKTVQDLKKERPDISFKEIASLLNIDLGHVKALYKKRWWLMWWKIW